MNYKKPQAKRQTYAMYCVPKSETVVFTYEADSADEAIGRFNNHKGSDYYLVEWYGDWPTHTDQEVDGYVIRVKAQKDGSNKVVG